MTVRDLLTALQRLPRDAEVLAMEAGCEQYRSSSGLGSLCRDLCRDQVFGAGELLSEKNAGLRRQPTDRSDVIVHAIEDPV
jgi:hypothetical protein